MHVGGRGTSSTTAPPLKQPCTAGLHLRVHFDGFKATWDEWYDQRDFDTGMGSSRGSSSNSSSSSSSGGCGDSSCGSITVIRTHAYYICEYKFISMYVFPCHYCYCDRVSAAGVQQGEPKAEDA